MKSTRYLLFGTSMWSEDLRHKNKEELNKVATTMSESNALANGLAGAGGGIIAQIITYPLQTVLSLSLSLSICFSLWLCDQFPCNFSGKHAPANWENNQEEQAKFAHQHNHCSWHSSSDFSGSKFALFCHLVGFVYDGILIIFVTLY